MFLVVFHINILSTKHLDVKYLIIYWVLSGLFVNFEASLVIISTAIHWGSDYAI